MKIKLTLLTIALLTLSAAARLTLEPKIWDSATWDRLITQSPCIAVVQCGNPTPPKPNIGVINGPISDVGVRLMLKIKGTNNVSPIRLKTDHEMFPGRKYLVLGYCDDGVFTAYEEYRVVPLPDNFATNEVQGKTLTEKVESLLSRRLFDLQNELAPLLAEEKRIAPAVDNSRLQWFDSGGPVTLGEIREANTGTNDYWDLWLELGGNQLRWSGGGSWKKADFYCTKDWKPLWEFSSCNATNLEELNGKPLTAKFQGIFTPGRSASGLGWSGPETILVCAGQIFLVRTTLAPDEVFVIQVQSQKANAKGVAVRYATIQNGGTH